MLQHLQGLTFGHEAAHIRDQKGNKHRPHALSNRPCLDVCKWSGLSDPDLRFGNMKDSQNSIDKRAVMGIYPKKTVIYDKLGLLPVSAY